MSCKKSQTRKTSNQKRVGRWNLTCHEHILIFLFVHPARRHLYILPKPLKPDIDLEVLTATHVILTASWILITTYRFLEKELRVAHLELCVFLLSYVKKKTRQNVSSTPPLPKAFTIYQVTFSQLNLFLNTPQALHTRLWPNFFYVRK
jgi:hypothetical protein